MMQGETDSRSDWDLEDWANHLWREVHLARGEGLEFIVNGNELLVGGADRDAWEYITWLTMEGK